MRAEGNSDDEEKGVHGHLAVTVVFVVRSLAERPEKEEKNVRKKGNLF